MPGILEMVEDELMFLRIDKPPLQEPNAHALPDHDGWIIDGWIIPLIDVVRRFLLHLDLTAILTSVSARQTPSLSWRTCHRRLVYPKRTATHRHSHSPKSGMRDLLSVLSRCLPPLTVGESRPHHEVPFHSREVGNDPK